MTPGSGNDDAVLERFAGRLNAAVDEAGDSKDTELSLMTAAVLIHARRNGLTPTRHEKITWTLAMARVLEALSGTF